MPLRTETSNFDDEEQRLQDEIDELDAVIDQLRAKEDVDESVAQTLLERLQTLQMHLEGVRWARDEAFDAEYAPAWDEDVDEVTFGGLTGGEFGRLQDDIDGAGTGAARIYQVEMGTEEAPYFDDSMDKDQRIATVSNLPVHYLMWAESQIDELTGIGGNGQMSYDDLLAEM
ncbi:hypothetical protein [Natrinema salifodinae]|uniref:Uncharacterized protein n=1 Tax=Natrinema salifodinae TaxID=1202768 RepID=A0A1I0P8B0_9EURY|nr:hypothetical protein [Natrinema salifodinae]SEW10289.1 hypothetical protein SAMN05216285_2244 [Natrinema salifodinae]